MTSYAPWPRFAQVSGVCCLAWLHAGPSLQSKSRPTETHDWGADETLQVVYSCFVWKHSCKPENLIKYGGVDHVQTMGLVFQYFLKLKKQPVPFVAKASWGWLSWWAREVWPRARGKGWYSVKAGIVATACCSREENLVTVSVEFGIYWIVSNCT